MTKCLTPLDRFRVEGSIHVPTNESILAFDRELISLAKYTTDLLNEKAIERQVGTWPNEQNIKGIRKLEILVDQDNLDDGGLCAALRDVYGTRTRSSAHSKSSSFDKSVLLNGATTFPHRFEQMLNALADGYEAIAASLLARRPGGPAS